MRVVAALFWLALVLAGTIWALIRPGGEGARAPSLLPQGTLIVPGMLARSDLDMKYILPATGVPARGIVDSAMVSADPVVPALPQDSVFASAPIAWADVAKGLNADATAQLCRDTASIAGITITLVRCDAARQDCAAIFPVPITADAELKQLANRDKLRVAAGCQ